MTKIDFKIRLTLRFKSLTQALVFR